MEEFNLRTLEHLGVQLFELFVSFIRTLFHLVIRPRSVFASLRSLTEKKEAETSSSGPPETTRDQECYGDGINPLLPPGFPDPADPPAPLDSPPADPA